MIFWYVWHTSGSEGSGETAYAQSRQSLHCWTQMKAQAKLQASRPLDSFAYMLKELTYAYSVKASSLSIRGLPACT